MRKVTSTSRADPRGTGSSAADRRRVRARHPHGVRAARPGRAGRRAPRRAPGRGHRPRSSRTCPTSSPSRPGPSSPGRCGGPTRPRAWPRPCADQVRPRLLSMDGVSFARVTGGRRRVLSVELDPDRLAGYGLTPDAVRSRLLALDQARPAGLGRARRPAAGPVDPLPGGLGRRPRGAGRPPAPAGSRAPPGHRARAPRGGAGHQLPPDRRAAHGLAPGGAAGGLQRHRRGRPGQGGGGLAPRRSSRPGPRWSWTQDQSQDIRRSSPTSGCARWPRPR